MREDRLFPEGTIPEYTQPHWYLERESAPHIDQSAHRPRLDCAMGLVMTVWEPTMTVVDLGAGDGGPLSLLTEVPVANKWGYDLAPNNVSVAQQRGQDVRYGDVYAGIEWADIAITTEMLEHLVDPHGFANLISHNCRYLVASSPQTETAEHHYEFHAWAWDKEGYAAMLEANGWEILQHVDSSVYQVALCRSKNYA